MIKKILLATTLIVTGAATHYLVPQTDVVRAVGVETKRVDSTASGLANGETTRTRDVYYIQTEDTESAKPKVYSNEDNYWYLKWNSADLQSRAQSLASDKSLVAVRHYGWRNKFFSLFPNATKIEPVAESYSTVPYLFFIVLTLVWGAILTAYWKAGKMISRISERRREKRATREADRNPVAASTSAADIDEFLNS
ncbi:DUF1523 family protein [Sulfitobacter sp. 1A13353]|uniref:DUF1523 family protein n=1 Tax=Sulfitobacter sp. 1A13353 TaxID=3368568 RepID=UPI0037467805